MLPSVVIFVLLAGLSVGDGAQCASSSNQASPVDATAHFDTVQITHGPVVESLTDTTAIIAWSTNVNAGTQLHYGTDPKHMDQTASMPWGGLTHRVNLKDLSPATVYFFQAESPNGQGTGTNAKAELGSFQTKAGPHP